MALFTTYNLFELFIAFSVMPLVFIFLWCLIVGDFKVCNCNLIFDSVYVIQMFGCFFLYRISRVAEKHIVNSPLRIQLTVIKIMLNHKKLNKF